MKVLNSCSGEELQWHYCHGTAVALLMNGHGHVVDVMWFGELPRVSSRVHNVLRDRTMKCHRVQSDENKMCHGVLMRLPKGLRKYHDAS